MHRAFHFSTDSGLRAPPTPPHSFPRRTYLLLTPAVSPSPGCTHSAAASSRSIWRTCFVSLFPSTCPPPRPCPGTTSAVARRGGEERRTREAGDFACSKSSLRVCVWGGAAVIKREKEQGSFISCVCAGVCMCVCVFAYLTDCALILAKHQRFLLIYLPPSSVSLPPSLFL